MVSLLILASTMVAGQTGGNEVLPQNVVDHFEYMIGDWDVEGTVAGVEWKGKYSCEWAPGRHCYIIKAQHTSIDPVGHMSGVVGYDPVHKKFIENNFWSNGSHYTLTYDASDPMKEKGTAEGTITGVEDGQDIQGKSKVERRGSKEWVYYSQTADGEPIKVFFRKAK